MLHSLLLLGRSAERKGDAQQQYSRVQYLGKIIIKARSFRNAFSQSMRLGEELASSNKSCLTCRKASRPRLSHTTLNPQHKHGEIMPGKENIVQVR